MANTAVNIKQIPLIYASKEVLEERRKVAWYKAVWSSVAVIPVAGMAASSIVGVFAETSMVALAAIAVPAGLLSALYVFGAYFLIVNARSEYDNYRNYGKFIKEGKVDLDKISKSDSVEFAISSFAGLDNNEASKPYAKTYVDKILKDSGPLPKNISYAKEADNKKSYLDVFLPYRSEYITSKKFGLFVGALLSGTIAPAACIAILTSVVLDGAAAINPAIVGMAPAMINAGFVAFVACIIPVSFYAAYYLYKEGKVYSKISAEGKIADKKDVDAAFDKLSGQYVSADGITVFNRYEKVDIKRMLKQSIYDFQDDFNKVLYRCVPDRGKREDVVARFVDMVQQSRQQTGQVAVGVV